MNEQLMILVDDAGGAFPSINHSPWFGITLADFVMPFFLFLVGVSISLAFKVEFILLSPHMQSCFPIQSFSKTPVCVSVVFAQMILPVKLVF